MIDLGFLNGHGIAVMGLGRSGLATARALAQAGAHVHAWDDSETRRAAAAEAGLAVEDLTRADLSDVSMLVLSPGIPHRFPQPHPVAERALGAGCEIVVDVELLARAEPVARIVAITGTNGKSTTTALVHHILREAGVPTDIGGNFGPPALEMASLDQDGVYVLELSSYQTERISTLRPAVGVVLNISPDHLDRHGGIEGYVAAKRRLVDQQDRGATAVIGLDDPWCQAIARDVAEGRALDLIGVTVTGARPDGGPSARVRVSGGTLHDAIDGQEDAVADLTRAHALPGAHNWQNAAAAYAVARALDVDRDAIVAALMTFPGLPHRQEVVARAGHVTFVNDSKATNAEAAARALVCYDAIYWIAGGLAKDTGLAGVEDALGAVKCAFLIGDAAERFADMLAPHIPVRRCGTLDAAVSAAYLAAADHDGPAVVLLSPAAASFDQFDNFEDRGAHFRMLAQEIAHRGAHHADNGGTTMGGSAPC